MFYGAAAPRDSRQSVVFVFFTLEWCFEHRSRNQEDFFDALFS